MYKPIQKKRKADEIAEQMENSIVTGEIKVGERFPYEKDLIKQFGASKATVRESLKILESKGLVEIRPGHNGGTYVKGGDFNKSSCVLAHYLRINNLKLSDLTRVRMIIEPAIIRESEGNFTAENIKKLRDINIKCRELMSKGKSIAVLEVEFHKALSTFVNNTLLTFLVEFIEDLLIKSKKEMSLPADFEEQVLTYHEKIVEYLEKGEIENAAQTMFFHVRDVGAVMEKYKENEETGVK